MGPVEYDVATNSSPELLADLNNIPLRYVNGAMVYVRDVAFVHDGFSAANKPCPQERAGPSALLPVLTSGSASTLSVVQGRSANDAQDPWPACPKASMLISCSIKAFSSVPPFPAWSARE